MIKRKPKVKAKLEEVKVEKPKRARRVPVAAAKEPEQKVEAKVEAKVENKLPVFEKHQVLRILDSGHTKTHFHCAMEGGFSQHVPKNKFN